MALIVTMLAAGVVASLSAVVETSSDARTAPVFPTRPGYGIVSSAGPLEESIDWSEGNTSEVTIVAAHNTPERGAADYICNGVADDQTVQAAIDSLPDNGGEVLLLPGDYRFSADGEYCVEIPDNVVLRGNRGDPARIGLVGQPSKGMFVTDDWRWNPPYAKVSNVTLRNLVIDAGSPKGFWREGDWGNHWDFFALCGSIEHLVVDNVHFKSRNPGEVTTRLFLWQCNDVSILNSTFEGVAIWLFSHTDNDDPASITGGDALVEGCLFSDTCDKMAIGANMKGLTIRGNRFRDCRSTAIDVGISPNALVEQNSIMGAAGNGIYGEGGYGQVFRDNAVDGVLADEPGGWNGFGIALRDNLHMRLGGDSLIEGNTITNCGNGLAVMGVPNVSVSGNVIAGIDARAIQVGCVVDEGLYFDGIPSFSDDCLISGNTIVDFGRAAGFSKGVLLVDVRNCVVSSNLIDGLGNAGALSGVEVLCWQGRRGHETISHLFSGRPGANIIENNAISGVSEPIRYAGQE